MCGSIAIEYDPALDAELEQFFSAEEIAAFRDSGRVVFAFWDHRPLLPVHTKDRIRLLDWGDRSGELKLPKTGWARLESLLAGKWDHLQPRVVRIAASQGCDNKIWVKLSKDIRGVVVTKGGQHRVYMITEAADEAWSAATKHDRMPRLMP